MEPGAADPDVDSVVLAVQEAQEAIATFRGFDTNNTGLIPSDVVKDSLKTVGSEPFSEEEAEEAVSEFRVGDDMINYEAMCVAMFSGLRVSEYHAQIAASPMHFKTEKELAESTAVIKRAIDSGQVAREENDRNQAEGCCVIQ